MAAAAGESTPGRYMIPMRRVTAGRRDRTTAPRVWASNAIGAGSSVVDPADFLLSEVDDGVDGKHDFPRCEVEIDVKDRPLAQAARLVVRFFGGALLVDFAAAGFFEGAFAAPSRRAAS